MKVLVIDDSSATRFMIKRILKEAIRTPHEVIEAENGQIALRQLAENPDTSLALVDWNMPVMNGYDFVIESRKVRDSSSLKLVMVTTETEMGQVVKALQGGVDEYVMKPFTKEVLTEKFKLLGID